MAVIGVYVSTDLTLGKLSNIYIWKIRTILAMLPKPLASFANRSELYHSGVLCISNECIFR